MAGNGGSASSSGVSRNGSQTQTITAGSGVSRNSGAKVVYDPKTGKWIEQSSSKVDGNYAGGGGTASSSGGVSRSNSKSAQSSATNTKTTESTKKAEAQYTKQLLGTLSGDLEINPTLEAIKLNQSETIQCSGFGKFLSGTYFIKSITRTISSSAGYEQSMNLLKNGFGDSLKPNAAVEQTTEELPVNTPTINVGDRVQVVGENAIYSNASEGKKVPDWVKQNIYTVSQLSTDGTRALLKEITSWTYLTYLKKV